MPYVIVAIVLIGMVLGCWLIFGPGPRRWRIFRRAQRLLEQGDWAAALRLVSTLQTSPRLSANWQGRLRSLAGECHQRAADFGLKEKRFEDALEHTLRAAAMQGLQEAEARARVLDAMLAECRRLFASGSGTVETQATLQLLGRVFTLQTPCAEASFWQGLCLIRQGNDEQALHALGLAHEQAGKQVIDPALYIGMLLHRQGRPQEGLRYLAEANRVDAGCPFITWQMGVSLVAGGGDNSLALRALQRAVGPRGLSMWTHHPDRAWVEAFPDGKSFVRRLASRHSYACPVLGSDLAVILRLGQLALAQAQYRQGNFQEAADLYTKLLQDSPPTLALLRGLGLSLARLERYDQAYKHLRIALDQENPKDPFTAGYLALCGALGKPTQPEDKPRNIVWAIRLLARFPVTAQPEGGHAGALGRTQEWAGLISAVHAEARALGIEIAQEDQLLLCDTLATVRATDGRAAAAYAHLAHTFPNAVLPVHAWLYTRAATTLGFTGERDMDLFARTFRDAGPARAYFEQQQWSFQDAEYTYLERYSTQAPGAFPEILGADYPPRGETFLLERSQREEEAGRNEAARACVEVLLRLAPDSLRGHDRLACLHFRRGDLEQAVSLLSGWQRLAPDDYWPLVRQAILEQQRGNARRRAEAIDRALGLTRGRLRGAVAYLGARLALRDAMGKAGSSEAPAANGKPADHSPLPANLGAFAGAVTLLEECLQHDPDHVEALWSLAAVRSVVGDREGLAQQAPTMDRPHVADARFHFLGAVCHLASGAYAKVIELGQRASTDEGLALESQFVMAWAHLHQQDTAAARQALQKVATTNKGPSAIYARALLGQLHFARGEHDEAIRWWSGVEAARRASWKLDEPLRQTALLAGLLNYQAERFEQAAERFREAGRLGLRDRRLGQLLVLALVRAGQRLLYEQATPALQPAWHVERAGSGEAISTMPNVPPATPHVAGGG
jgi:tetratricopeptide (TPR) repeat protein